MSRLIQLTAQHVPELRLRLSQAEHDTRLGDDIIALEPLHLGQHLQALPEGCPPVTNVRRQPLDRLDIVGIDVQPALGHDLDHVQVAAEVAGQGLDQQGGLLGLDAADGLGEVVGAAVSQVVAVHAGEDDVAQPPAGQGLGGVLGLVGVEGRGPAVRLDTAEAAAAGAGVAHEHDGGGGGVLVVAAPALADVGASGLLAHRVQPQAAQVRLDLAEVGVGPRRGDRGLEPLGQAGDGLLAPGGADLDGAELVGLALGERAAGGFVGDEGVEGGEGCVLEVCWADAGA